jgi:hypothetical protein
MFQQLATLSKVKLSKYHFDVNTEFVLTNVSFSPMQKYQLVLSIKLRTLLDSLITFELKHHQTIR